MTLYFVGECSNAAFGAEGPRFKPRQGKKKFSAYRKKNDMKEKVLYKAYQLL